MSTRNDIKDIFYTTVPIIGHIIKRLKYAVNTRIYRYVFLNAHPTTNIKVNPSSNIEVHQLTLLYQNKVKDIILDSYNMVDDINNIIDSYMMRIMDKISAHREDGNNEKIQEETFKQIIYFLNSLCHNELHIRNFNNSLSKNDIKDFKDKTIGDKIYSVLPTGKGKAGGCWHLSMIVKQFFDILESKGLKISSHLFVEKRAGGNHAGVIVKFSGKIYLIDPYINTNFLIPISDLEQDIQDRMKRIIPEVNKSNSINSIIKMYSESNENFFKVVIESNEDLVQFLNSIPNKSGYVRLYDRDLLSILGYSRFQLFNNGILLSNKLFYEFNNKFSKEELNKISDDDLIYYLFSNITHKIDKKHGIIKAFKSEKEYLVKKLSKNSDRINFGQLRKILLGNNEYHPN